MQTPRLERMASFLLPPGTWRLQSWLKNQTPLSTIQAVRAPGPRHVPPLPKQEGWESTVASDLSFCLLSPDARILEQSHEYPKPNETLRALPYHPSFPSSQAAAGSFQSLWSLKPCPHRVPLPRQPAAAPAKQTESVCMHVTKAGSVRPLPWVGLEGAS